MITKKSRDKIWVGTTYSIWSFGGYALEKRYDLSFLLRGVSWEAIPKCGSIKSKTATKLFYRLQVEIWEPQGYLRLHDQYTRYSDNSYIVQWKYEGTLHERSHNGFHFI